MADGSNFVCVLTDHIGQTVTIFTTSGGDSGSGFTGVLASVNCNFVRLITQIGPAPGCALGSCCDDIGFCDNEDGRNRQNLEDTDDFNNRRFNCHVNNFGSIVDIPIIFIAAFVHNAVGSNM
jgi:hypothetical protein